VVISTLKRNDFYYYYYQIIQGQKISTKALGKNNYQRLDITEDYKYPEGSALELITVKRALHLTDNKLVSDTPSDLKYSLYTAPSIEVGKDIILRLNVKNTSPKNRNIKIITGRFIILKTNKLIMSGKFS